MSNHQPTGPDDIEALHAEALAGFNPTTEERWLRSAQLASLIMRALRGERVTTGHPRAASGRTDYITASPNPPLTVFGPDGRFIVSFLKDGTWIEATGRVASTANFLEGTPGSIARLLITDAGYNLAPQQSRTAPRNRPSKHYEDALLRLLQPHPTDTWLDNVQLPHGQTWDEHTPASICRESAATRLILAPYDPNACTFATTGHLRWGVESLRIPAIPDEPLSSFATRAHEQVRAGDCLLTLGPKHADPAQQLEFDSDELQDLQGTLVWFPQRVVRVEPEGADHLRVWLARDKHVANDYADPDGLGPTLLESPSITVVLDGDDAQAVYQHFQLNVFCGQCGNRAKPIVYGLPTSEDPSYVAIGGCIFEEDAPNYTCSCSHIWRDHPDNDWRGEGLSAN